MNLTKSYLRQLLEADVTPPYISIYMPTHPLPGRETRQDSIRLKTLLGHVRDELQANNDLNSREIDTLLQPAEALLADETFWKSQNEGLVLFLNAEGMDMHRLPLEMPELTFVGERFYVKPLMPLVNEDGTFYLLALSQNQIRFFNASRHHIERIALSDDMPTSLDEALRFDEDSPALQHHSGRSASAEQSEIYHTQDPQDNHKTNVLRFMKTVENHVTAYLRRNADKAPLLLAGVDFVQALYREANHYAHLIENKGITGNPDNLSSQDLHGESLDVMQPHFELAQQSAFTAFRNQIATDATTSDLRSLLPAAHHAQIATLFLKQNGMHWGTYDEPTDTLTLHEEPAPRSDELLDLAAAETLKHGGDVFVVSPEEMPTDAPAAAILRF